MTWPGVIATRPNRVETLEAFLKETGNQDAARDHGPIIYSALSLDRVESLRPSVLEIRTAVDRIIANMPRWGTLVLHKLAGACIVLEILGEPAPDLREAMADAKESDAEVLLQKRIALRSGWAGKPSKSKGIPKPRKAFLKRLEGLPTAAALELANCPLHINHVPGRMMTLFLAKNLQAELKSAGEECRIEDLLQFGSRWRERESIAGWQLPSKGQSRVFIQEGDDLVVYHWLGYARETETLLDEMARVVTYAQHPELQDFEVNRQAREEVVEFASTQVTAARMRHVLVFDSNLPGVKRADLAEVPGAENLDLKLVDILSA
ncbi:MAG: hypothetical protein MK135_16630 [Polyangiaceae bacterium]|nr:hypothetical protein [Polyangiaceae bacterium]